MNSWPARRGGGRWIGARFQRASSHERTVPGREAPSEWWPPEPIPTCPVEQGAQGRSRASRFRPFSRTAARSASYLWMTSFSGTFGAPPSPLIADFFLHRERARSSWGGSRPRTFLGSVRPARARESHRPVRAAPRRMSGCRLAACGAPRGPLFFGTSPTNPASSKFAFAW